MWLRHLLTWVQQPSQIWPPALFPCPIGTILLQSMGGGGGEGGRGGGAGGGDGEGGGAGGGEHFTCEHLRHQSSHCPGTRSSTSDVSAIFLCLSTFCGLMPQQLVRKSLAGPAAAAVADFHELRTFLGDSLGTPGRIEEAVTEPRLAKNNGNWRHTPNPTYAIAHAAS